MSSGCGGPAQQSDHAEIFVDVRPVHTLAIADEAPILALFRLGVE
jgi:hypothetical protein